MMITVEVKNCLGCLFRGYYNQRHLCLATRLGQVVRSPISLPTAIPDKYVPAFMERDKPYPDPPDWCPMNNRYIVIGQEGAIPKRVTEIPNLWPENIGKLPEWKIGDEEEK